MSLRRSLLAASSILVLAAAGCGGGGSKSGGSKSGGAGTSPKETFANTCGGCHTLKAAGTQGQVGPNLDKLKPDAALVRKTIKEGPSVMPSNLLTGSQADAVAKYVADNAGR